MKSMYMIIKYNRGMEALSYFLEQDTTMEAQNKSFILKCVACVLKNICGLMKNVMCTWVCTFL